MSGLDTGMVAYVVLNDAPSRRGVWTMHADGSHRRRVAAEGEQPRWTPDGTRLTYQTGWFNGDLVSVAADGTDPQVLLRGRVASGAAFAPDGSKVAVVRSGGDTTRHLVVLDLATGMRTRVPNTAPGFPRVGGEWGLDWSPDGSRLAFVGNTGEEYDGYSEVTALFTIRLDGTDLRRLTGRAQVMGPRWSPDGTRLLYATNSLGRDGTGEGTALRSVAADGTDERVVPSRGDGRSGPGDWSPDGTRIISSSDGLEGYLGRFGNIDGLGWRAPLQGLWQMNPDGTGARFVVRTGGTWPDWGSKPTVATPDPTSTPLGGDRPMVLSAASETGFDLMMLEPDGTTRPLTTDGLSQAPTLTPAGTRVRFLRRAVGGQPRSAWRIGVDGTGETQLLDRAGFYLLPTWGPRGRRLLLPEDYRVRVRNLITGTRQTILREHGGWTGFRDGAWSDDGQYVAVTAEHYDQSYNLIGHALFVMRPNGDDLRRVVTTTPRQALGQPDFSPDGRWIAFTRQEIPWPAAPTDVWVVRLDGQRAHPVMATAEADFAPAWGPSGRRLAVISDGPRPYGARPSPGVWVVRRDGTRPHLVLPARGLVDIDW